MIKDKVIVRVNHICKPPICCGTAIARPMTSIEKAGKAKCHNGPSLEAGQIGAPGQVIKAYFMLAKVE